MNTLEEKRGLWANIHAKRQRIRSGSGERMRDPGDEGAPSAADLKRSQVKEAAEKHSMNKNEPSSRFEGSKELVTVYKKDTPGQNKTLRAIKKVVREALDDCGCGGDCKCNPKKKIEEAEYQGRSVPLGKPMKGDVKKSKVYVKNEKGSVVKVNFGDKNMTIKKDIPARRKSFRARHNCDNPGPRTKARYWSCRAW